MKATQEFFDQLRAEIEALPDDIPAAPQAMPYKRADEAFFAELRHEIESGQFVASRPSPIPPTHEEEAETLAPQEVHPQEPLTPIEQLIEEQPQEEQPQEEQPQEEPLPETQTEKPQTKEPSKSPTIFCSHYYAREIDQDWIKKICKEYVADKIKQQGGWMAIFFFAARKNLIATDYTDDKFISMLKNWFPTQYKKSPIQSTLMSNLKLIEEGDLDTWLKRKNRAKNATERALRFIWSEGNNLIAEFEAKYPLEKK